MHRHGCDASDTPAVKKKKIPGYLSSFRQFRRIPVCSGDKFVPGRYKMNEFFFFLSIFGTYISLSLECWMTIIVQISACRIILTSSSSFQQSRRFRWTILSLLVFISGSNSLFSLHPWKTERQSHFILKWDKFLFFGQKGEHIGTCTSTELTFLFFFKASDGSCAFTAHHQVLTLDVGQSLLWRFIYIIIYIFSFRWGFLWRFIYGSVWIGLILLKLKTYYSNHCSKIIFKCVNSIMGPIFNEKVAKKWNLWIHEQYIMHCLRQKSQHLWLLFIEQYMNSNRNLAKTRKKI